MRCYTVKKIITQL